MYVNLFNEYIVASHFSEQICFYRIDMGTDQTAELSDAGYQFLIDLFNRHDKVRRLVTLKRIIL